MKNVALWSMMLLASCTDGADGTPVDSCSTCEPGAIRTGRVFAEDGPYSLVAANARGETVRANSNEVQWLDGSLAPIRTRSLTNASGAPLEAWKLAIGPAGDVVVLAGIIEPSPEPHPIGSLIAFRKDGSERWRMTFKIKGPSNLSVGERRVFLGSGAPTSFGLELDGKRLMTTYAAALDLDSGALKWALELPSPTSSASSEKSVFVAALPGDECAIGGTIPRYAPLALGDRIPAIPPESRYRAFVAAIDVKGNARWVLPIVSERESEVTALASSPDGEIAPAILHDFMAGSSQPEGSFGGHAYRGTAHAALISLDGEARWIQPTIQTTTIATDGAEVVVGGYEAYRVDRPAIARVTKTGERWRRKAPSYIDVAAVAVDHIVAGFSVYDGVVYGETTFEESGVAIARLVP